MIDAGAKAPAFRLKDQDGNQVTLASLGGQWVVLYFYPRDETPGCTTEACEFTAGIRGFRRLGVVVLGCSPDSPDAHRAFVRKYKLKLTLLSDPTHATMEKYGAWGQKVLYGKTSIGVIRSTVVIAPDGNIAHRWKKVKAAGHAAHVRTRLAQLQNAHV